MSIKIRDYIRLYVNSLIGLVADISGLVPGLLLASYLSMLADKPWLLTVYPGMLTVRGCIAGIVSGRLSTGLHLGTISPSFKKVTDEYFSVLCSAVTLSLVSSMALTVSVSLVNSLLGVDMPDALSTFCFVTAAIGASTLVLLPVNSLIAFTAFKGRLDPDLILYPASSSIADFGVTILFLLLASRLEEYLFLYYFFTAAFVAATAFLLVKGLEYREYVETVEQSLLALLLVAAIVNVSGQALKGISRMIESDRSVYVMYPAMIDVVGDVSSMLGSVVTTRLALGLTGSLSMIVKEMPFLLAPVLLATLTALVPISMMASAMAGIPIFGKYFFTVAAVSLAILPMAAVTLLVVFLTYRYRLNSDNFVNPLSSAIADAVTTVSIYLVLAMASPG